ncbi:MAG: DUF547 domain-containing protein [Cyclobacteriaceae bacterium]
MCVLQPMRYFNITFLLIVLLGCSNVAVTQGSGDPISHEIWDTLLKKYVTKDGFVDYKGIQNEKIEFDSYLRLLEANPPNKETWTEEEQIAYWINAYNAYTVDLILQYYPLESIKDIGSSIQIPFVNTPWDVEFIKIAGEEYDLNDLEHGILRGGFEEPRIHFAVNCASFSCPELRAEAYTGEKLEQQLDEQARIFVNDTRKNRITAEKAELSKIFSWYSGDFNDDMSVTEFINQYTDVKITKSTDVDYLDYNWELNDLPN